LVATGGAKVNDWQLKVEVSKIAAITRFLPTHNPTSKKPQR
jgi:hypothetical protein